VTFVSQQQQQPQYQTTTTTTVPGHFIAINVHHRLLHSNFPTTTTTTGCRYDRSRDVPLLYSRNPNTLLDHVFFFFFY